MEINKIDNLSESDKELFAKCIQKLLSRSFIIEKLYHKDKNMYRNPMYSFIEEHESIVREYFKYSGFEIVSDTNNGVFYIENIEFDNNVNFSKITTIFLLLVRLIYEEKQENVTIGIFNTFSLSELLNKVDIFHFYNNMLSDTKIKDGLKELCKYNFIEKISGSYADTTSIYVIYPSILHCVDGNTVRSILEQFKETSEDIAEVALGEIGEENNEIYN